MHDFYRLYEIMTAKEVAEIEKYLYSFIVYVLISRNGINKGGQPDFEYREEDIKTLYPEYSADSLPESIVQWIEEGILDEDMIAEDISHWLQEGERTAASPHVMPS